MSENIKGGQNKKIFNEIIKNALFFLATVLIIWFFPHDAQYKYQFSEGKPWQYDLLTATFDFPIYKTERELILDRNNILKSNKPYFKVNSSKENEKINLLYKDINKNIQGDSSLANNNLYFDFLKKQFHYVYSVGVLDDAQYINLANKQVRYVVIVEHNVGKTRNIADIFTEDKAIEYIFSQIPKGLSFSKIKDIRLSKYIESNLSYDLEITNKIKSDELNNISITSGRVQAGERIIDRGEIVSPEKFKILDSLKKQYQQEGSKKSQYVVIAGQSLIVFCLILLFYLYTRLFRKKFFTSKRFVTLTLLLIVGFTLITSVVVQRVNPTFVYLIPYCLIPIVISTFFDTRTGLFSHIITILLCSFMVPLPFEFVLLEITAGMVAIHSLKDISQRSQLVQSAIMIFTSYCLMYFGYGMTLDGDFLQIKWIIFVFFLINGGLLLFAYPLIYIFEKAFGFISNVTLVELSNINNPVLRKLSELAPGTFQHSMQVSNLAAEIAVKTKANPLLARTGAMYHDIGKMKNPAFFAENQSKGNNPHDQLSYEDSAKIIIQHVADGVEIAKEAKIPKMVIEFIETHHGKNKVRYFYNSFKTKFPDKKIDEDIFTYKGLIPYTKETAIVMLCDSVEAASRSLPEYTDDSINTLVENIINSLLADGALNNAPLTLKQISLTKHILKEKLKNIYHTRIAYPELTNNIKP